MNWTLLALGIIVAVGLGWLGFRAAKDLREREFAEPELIGLLVIIAPPLGLLIWLLVRSSSSRHPITKHPG